MAGFDSDAVAAFAAVLRRRLAEVGDTVRTTVSAPFAPLLGRRDSADVELVHRHDPSAANRRNLAMVIVAAAAPFAPTAHARARLLRQAHASGLLTARETDEALDVVRAIGAPRS
ncbi:MAG: hypothetical protein QOG80_742 [Pseudonocardiales bacterium]|jgi:hypothetical protein|nr:hypothetical protein [Pseudonocardiales bacterium]